MQRKIVNSATFFPLPSYFFSTLIGCYKNLKTSHQILFKIAVAILSFFLDGTTSGAGLFTNGAFS
jgi:hypothetical protein